MSPSSEHNHQLKSRASEDVRMMVVRKGIIQEGEKIPVLIPGVTKNIVVLLCKGYYHNTKGYNPVG